LRRHLAPFFAGRSLDRIDAQLVAEYLVAKRRDGLSSKTVNNQLTFLHDIFRHGMKKGWTRANPVPPSTARATTRGGPGSARRPLRA
jgi:site-specific recombinase XerD